MNHPERIIQMNLVNWLRQKHPEIKFQANLAEQKCTASWRSILHRMGMRKGVSDLFFPASNQGFKGMWLELKADKGRPSKEQIEFIEDMKSEGYAGFITFGHEESEEKIKWFFSL
jgi:hypothetical protein